MGELSLHRTLRLSQGTEMAGDIEIDLARIARDSSPEAIVTGIGPPIHPPQPPASCPLTHLRLCVYVQPRRGQEQAYDGGVTIHSSPHKGSAAMLQRTGTGTGGDDA